MTAGFAAVAEHHPDTWEGYAAYIDEVWSNTSLPPGLLELCRLRIAQLLGADAEFAWRLGPEVPDLDAKVAALRGWPTDPVFTATDRVALTFAEQFLLDVQALDDLTCAAVVDEVGDAGLATLAIGVGLAEAMTRAAVVLGDRPAPGRSSSFVGRAADRA